MIMNNAEKRKDFIDCITQICDDYFDKLNTKCNVFLMTESIRRRQRDKIQGVNL